MKTGYSPLFCCVCAAFALLFSCNNRHTDNSILPQLRHSLDAASDALKMQTRQEFSTLESSVDFQMEYAPVYDSFKPILAATAKAIEQIQQAEAALQQPQKYFYLPQHIAAARQSIAQLHRQIRQAVDYAATQLDSSGLQALLQRIAPLADETNEDYSLMFCRWQHDAHYATHQAIRWLNDAIDHTNAAEPKHWRIHYIHTPIFARKNAYANAVLRRGDSLQIWASLYGYAPHYATSISVNGAELSSENGKFSYKARPNQAGENRYTATARITNPFNRQTYTAQRTFYYYAAEE